MANTVFVTGANGYIGGAVARAFRRAGYVVYGLVRRPEAASELEKQEMHAIVGTPEDLSFIAKIPAGVFFDIIVSNTEDHSNMAGHYAKVQLMLEKVAAHSVAVAAAAATAAANTNTNAAVAHRPLVFFTSGCKDYGMDTLLSGDVGLTGHTEQSPLDTIPLLAPRCDFGSRLLAQKAEEVCFDACVIRPTCVYGIGSSHYSWLFELTAAVEEEKGGVLTIEAPRNGMMHSLHVDDCGDAYVALAKAERAKVARQAFNVSNYRYETTEEVALALASLVGATVEWVDKPCENPFTPQGLFNWPQWVRSDKIRALTGWTETRAPFAAGIREYALAYRANKSVCPRLLTQ